MPEKDNTIPEQCFGHRKKRTTVDFNKHKVNFVASPFLKLWDLRIPGSSENRVIFINAAGVLSVTGDFGNWIFCREFWPSATGYVSDSYWKEKATNSSTQLVNELDEDETIDELKKQVLLAEEEGYDEEDLEYFQECIDRVAEGGNDLTTYEKFAYENLPSDRGDDFIVVAKKTPEWLRMVFDGFEEICQRMQNGESFTTEAPDPVECPRCRKKVPSLHICEPCYKALIAPPEDNPLIRNCAN